MTEAEQVAKLRGQGAYVGFTPDKPGSAAVKVQARDHNYISLEYIDKVVKALSIRAMCGDITEADGLLLSILEDSNII